MSHLTANHPVARSPAIGENHQEEPQPGGSTDKWRTLPVAVPPSSPHSDLDGHGRARRARALRASLGLEAAEVLGAGRQWRQPRGTIGARNMACRNRSAWSAIPTCCPEARITAGARSTAFTNCPLCHPEVAQLKQTPVVTDADRQRAARALASAPRPENNAVCKNYRRRIQFASLEAVKKAGVDVGLVDRQPIASPSRPTARSPMTRPALPASRRGCRARCGTSRRTSATGFGRAKSSPWSMRPRWDGPRRN